MRHRVEFVEVDAHNAPEFFLDLSEAAEAASHDGAVLELDFSQVRFMDSTGVAALIAASGDLARTGRLLTVCNAAPNIQRLFTVAGIDDFLADR